MTIADSRSAPGTVPSSGGGWTGRTRGGVLGNWIFLFLLKTFGLRVAYALLLPVTLYYSIPATRAVRASADYFRRASGRRRNPLATFLRTWKHFYRFGQVLLDRVAIISGKGGFRFEFDGRQHLDEALAAGKGMLLITGHVGNWEAAGHVLSCLNVPVNVVVYEGELARIRRLFEGAMKAKRFTIIEAGESLKTALEISFALSRGEIVAMHADRAVSDSFVEVEFFGAPARLPAGPYLAAASSGAPLVTAFVFRKGMYNYTFKAWPARLLKFENRDDRMQLAQREAACFARRLEGVLKENPYQWFNFFDFWGGNVVER